MMCCREEISHSLSREIHEQKRQKDGRRIHFTDTTTVCVKARPWLSSAPTAACVSCRWQRGKRRPVLPSKMHHQMKS